MNFRIQIASKLRVLKKLCDLPEIKVTEAGKSLKVKK